MHIEPGVVDGAKILLSYGTAAGALGATAWMATQGTREHGLPAFVARCLLSALLVFCCFEVLPHHPVGVSEVHLILGTTLFLIFGPAAAAVGLAAGLATQSLFFAPADLPQFGMNVTTLIVPLLGLQALSAKIIPTKTAYVDLSYAQTFKLSAAYQGGIVAWVAFWAFYGQGVGADNLERVLSFGAAYMTVILVEPLVDLAVLAMAKTARAMQGTGLVERRIYVA